ncbi:MerR family transcriptional regulator [Rhodococcus sp. MALMAid1271]|uniref:MerR family transcriptional regulator n=1 Tax=Rhodococcus sp. MALMAid1271 TaxID=3411744 RepID=UPI003BA048A0
MRDYLDVDSPTLLTIADAAEKVGRTPAALRKWIERGLLKPVVTKPPFGHLVDFDEVSRVAAATRHRKGCLAEGTMSH